MVFYNCFARCKPGKWYMVMIIVVLAALVWLLNGYGGHSTRRPSLESGIGDKGKHISMLMFNLWFNDFHIEERMEWFGGIIEQLKPNIITLNEVTKKNLAMLTIQAWFDKYTLVPKGDIYQEMPVDLKKEHLHTVVLLTDLTVRKWRLLPFKHSQEGRRFVMAELIIPIVTTGLNGSTGKEARIVNTHFTIATAHLEWYKTHTKERERQLKKSMGILSPFSDACFTGELNLRQNIDGDIILPNPWRDSWLSLPSNSNANGYTWDPSINTMIKSGSKKARIDRVLCKLSNFKVDSMEIVGKKELSPGVFPSDHFGIYTVFSASSSPGHSNKVDAGEVIFDRPFRSKETVKKKRKMKKKRDI